MTIINAQNVSRSFNVTKNVSTNRKVIAVNDVSFSVESGEIFGMLGPNGAGKTTLIKMMTTVLLPTSGRISLMGLDTFTGRHKIRTKINVVFGGERGMYWKLTGRENLMYFAALYKIQKKKAAKRVDSLLERFGLSEFRDLPIGRYSSGMKQKIHFARALLNEPQILFLDEPTNAMDPKTANDVRGIILELQKNGRTIILATHNMLEADQLCDRLIIMDKGEIIKVGKPGALKHYLKSGKMELQLRGEWARHHFLDLGIDYEEIMVSQKDGITHIYAYGDKAGVAQILRKALELGAEIMSFSESIPELEEVYLKSVGQAK